MRIVILGGGIAGLLAAYVLRHRHPILLEAQPEVGGNYTAGGLKYIRHTPAFEQLLAELGITWKPHQPRGLLYADGMIHSHPDWLNKLTYSQRHRIQSAHWHKTRGDDVRVRPDCMNDPKGNGADLAMWCDHREFLSALAERAAAEGAIIKTGAKAKFIWPCSVDTNVGAFPYDRLVATLPMGLLAYLSGWAELPSARANDLTVVRLAAQPMDMEPSWDYLYTPLEKHISRITWPNPGQFQLEAPGKPSPSKLVNRAMDLLERFADDLEQITTRVIPGHLVPLQDKPRWPRSWFPLGRFAEWDPRATAEKVLDRVKDWEAKL